jgi:predicted Zn-dependent protease
LFEQGNSKTNFLKTTQVNGMKVLFAIMLSLAFVLNPFINQANAQRSLPLVRDAEIEGLIQDYTRPIFKAAGLRQGGVEVFLLNRNDFNAFVTGTRMFINTGAIMQAETPNEIIGVFAHETGHIIGGHLVRLRDRLEKAQVLSVLGLLAGAGAAAAGSAQGGAAIIAGSQGATQRTLLAYQREEELAADRAGVTLLNKTGQSAKGMITTFKRLGKNPLFSSGRLDPYAISHPVPRQRVALLTNVAKESPHFNKKDSDSLQLRHDLARAKIAAYSGGAGLVRNLFRKNLNGIAGTYGIAISNFLSGVPRRGIPMMDKLIKKMPNNPYFHEMKGEMLLRSGKAKEAATSFSKAVKLDKRQNGLLRIQLGHALLETNNKNNLKSAIKVLREGTSRDPYSSAGYGYLARAYGANGQQDLALAATAEARFLQGNIKQAKQFALRAQPRIKKGSPQWLRLQDIINYGP